MPLRRINAVKTHWGSRCIAPSVLNLGTRWRWVVSFTFRPFYPREKSLRYPLRRRLGGRDGKRHDPIIDTAGNWTPIVQSV